MRNICLVSVFIIFISVFFSCTHRKTAADFIKLGESTEQYNSVKEYYDARPSMTDTTFLLKFMFLNNPYNLDEKNIISIYLNSELVYRGPFEMLVDLYGNSDLLFKKRNQMIFFMEILTDKIKKTIWVHQFSSKMVFSWNENYKIVYCGFSTTNEDVEKVFFIPQLEPMQ